METPFTPPSHDEFAKLMMDRIHQAGEKSKLVYDPDEYLVRGEAERTATVYLTNAYQEYCTAPDDAREKVLKHWVRNWFTYLRDLPDEFEDAKHDLLPVVRSRWHFESTALQGEVESGVRTSWPYQVLGEHFGVGLVYDLPEAMRSIPQSNLDAWGVTFYEAMEVACKNLLALPSKFIRPPSGKGVYLSATGDSYDASRLLLADLIRQFRVRGDPIAMIPNRDNLIVTGAADLRGLWAMSNLAAEAIKKPRLISGIALRLDGDEWVPWLPKVSHPSYNDLQRLQLQSFGHDYADQKDLLDKLHAKNGEDVFAATFSVIRSPHSRVFSYATWTDTKNTLLPKTDVVVLGRISGKPAMVEWQKVVDVVGDLMEAVDIYPPRFRVRGFPSDDKLAAMGNMLP
jgi:uncharacterized protein YtpQ (UPF0354 family)